MRVIEGSTGADAHELGRPDLDDGHAGIVLEMRNDVIGHGLDIPKPGNCRDSRVAAAGTILTAHARAQPLRRQFQAMICRITNSDTIAPLKNAGSPSLVATNMQAAPRRPNVLPPTDVGRNHVGPCVVLCLFFSATAMLVWPHARDAAATFAAQDAPETLSDLRLAARGLSAADHAAEIQAALAGDDVELARSFADLAAAQGVALPPETLAAVAQAESRPVQRAAWQFARGFVTGEVKDGASLTGTLAGDLFVFGDIRDAVREGWHFASGGEVDPLILGLAGAGLAITAGTYASMGAAAPARAGLTLIKDARRAGKLGGGLIAVAAKPGVKAADRAVVLARVAKDANRVRGAAGLRASLDVMKLADSPADLARAARLAEKKGSQTRAIVKVLGRGALILGNAAFQLAGWLLWFALALFGVVSSIKATTERLTLSWLRRRKARRARLALAIARG